MKNSKLHCKYYVDDVHIDSAGEGAYVSASAQAIEVNVYKWEGRSSINRHCDDTNLQSTLMKNTIFVHAI